MKRKCSENKREVFEVKTEWNKWRRINYQRNNMNIIQNNMYSSPGLMHDTGCSGLVHWDDPEGWDGEGDGRGFRMGNTYTPMVESSQCIAKPIQCCKVK